FADVQQTLFARQELYKRTEFLDAFHGRFVYRTYFRNSYNTFDPGNSFIQPFFSRTEDAYLTIIAHFFDIDGSACFALDLLDDLALGPDHRTNEFLVDEQLFHSRRMWFHFRSCFTNRFVHG